MMRSVFICLLGALASAAAAAEPAAPHDYEREVRAILERRCAACHGVDAQEGGVNIAELKTAGVALQKRPLWKRALRRIQAGSMPPEDADPLTADEKRTVSAWLRFAIDYVDTDPLHRDPGPSTLRRLNRTEYVNTLRDLLGFEPASLQSVGLPDDAAPSGFDNQAASLGISPTLLEKYFAAADAAIAELYGEEQPQGRRGRNGGGNNAAARRAAYDRLFCARPSGDLPEREAARQIIARLTRLAYRRPVADEELTPLLALFDRARSKGAEFDAAVRDTLKPVLVSPYFLLRIERDRPAVGGATGVRIDSHELAVRLSYFLWSSMPDDELLAAADSGRLLEPEELERQTRRLLASPRASALTSGFFSQWLHLEQLARARPQTEFFPTFNSQLKDAMLAETTAFLDHLRREDRSLLELLDADYTFVNARLAEHYGIAGVSGEAVQRVALTPEQHRGGLLGMGSILAMTSHTFRTSPTQRGKWVLDVLLGDPPPPPPANAGVLKDEGRSRRSPQTFREQLAQHATVKSCAACHKKIDPLGFALDNYDAIGAWREASAERPLDTTGMLADGQRVSGEADLKRVLLERKDEFLRNLCEKMLAFALGRDPDYYDEATIREVQSQLAAGDNRLSQLVLGIVKSPTFQQRRRAEPATSQP